MGTLRVIAGMAKGKRLAMVPGSGTRPVPDKVKGAVFNILGADIVGARFLDLFAGTGSVGIEALSRGAASAVFVESGVRAWQTISRNLQVVALSDRAQLVKKDVFAFISEHRGEAFDYVYIAPPQYRGLWRHTLEALDRATACMHPDAWLMVQIHPREYSPLELHRLQEFDQRRYGSALVVFYEHLGAVDETSTAGPARL
jgi:16S rRNA (guanine966-N2)-methyltransferase